MLKFYILVKEDKEKYILNLKKYFNINFFIAEFNEETRNVQYNFLIDYLSSKKAGKAVHLNLMNYARIFLLDIFDINGICVYLDTDIIVQTDILNLLEYKLCDNYPCGAVLNRNMSYFDYKNFSIDNIDFIPDKSFIGFNTGVYMFDSEYWKKKELTKYSISILKLNKKKTIMNSGTQPLINLLFYKKTLNIDEKWNTAHVGSMEWQWERHNFPKKLDEGYILHWSGGAKPWLKNGLWKKYWEKYLCEPVSQ